MLRPICSNAWLFASVALSYRFDVLVAICSVSRYAERVAVVESTIFFLYVLASVLS